MSVRRHLMVICVCKGCVIEAAQVVVSEHAPVAESRVMDVSGKEFFTGWHQVIILILIIIILSMQACFGSWHLF